MSTPPLPRGKHPCHSRFGHFDVEIRRRHAGDTQAHLTGTLTRAADGEPYQVSLRLSHEYRPHPETDQIVRTRVLSGRLSRTGPKARRVADAPTDEGTPFGLGQNRIKLFENLAETAAAITREGRPNLHREATFYGLANIGGVIERVAAWELDNIQRLPGKLAGITRPFAPKPNLDLEDQMEQARMAMSAEASSDPQPSTPATGRVKYRRAPRAGQGTA